MSQICMGVPSGLYSTHMSPVQNSTWRNYSARRSGSSLSCLFPSAWRPWSHQASRPSGATASRGYSLLGGRSYRTCLCGISLCASSVDFSHTLTLLAIVDRQEDFVTDLHLRSIDLGTNRTYNPCALVAKDAWKRTDGNRAGLEDQVSVTDT